MHWEKTWLKSLFRYAFEARNSLSKSEFFAGIYQRVIKCKLEIALSIYLEQHPQKLRFVISNETSYYIRKIDSDL